MSKKSPICDECKEVRAANDLMTCSECKYVVCHECSDPLPVIFKCYICDSYTCENCEGGRFCDFCGNQDNFICPNHQVCINDIDRTACCRKECVAIAEYLNSNEDNQEKFDQLLKAADEASNKPPVIVSNN